MEDIFYVFGKFLVFIIQIIFSFVVFVVLQHVGL